MASKERIAKAGDAARLAAENPYVRRLIEDAELRDNMRRAFESARVAYGRFNNGKPPTKALFEDKKLQKELRKTAEALRDAGVALHEAPNKRRRRGGIGRALVILIVGAIVAIALSESLRSKLLDALFGAEEEFDYTSTTAPATPAPEPVSS